MYIFARMKKLIISSIILLLSFTGFSQAGFEWAQACGHPFYGETKSVLTTDQEGNVFMAGSFIETAVFGAESINSAGGTDIFIAKHNTAGEVLWLMADGGEDYDYLHGIAVDDDGFYTCGTFYGTTHIGSETFTSQGSQDIFLVRYDTEGIFSWARHIGSPKTDFVNAMCTDPEGNMIITGHYYDSISFGDTMLYAAAASDIFLAKYNVSGELQWLKQASGSSSDQSYSLSCDDEGNILFTGSYYNDILIGDTLLTTMFPTGVFMAKMDNNGTLQFVSQIDGNGLIAKSFATFDSNGDIFFTGNFTDQINIGSYYFDAGAFNIDIFITRYGADGELIWADHGYGIGSDQLISISAGPKKDIYISGHYLADIHFSDLTLAYNLCCGSEEIFLVRYTEDGIPAWGDSITGERAKLEAICKNENDELFVTGMFKVQLSFGDIILEGGDEYTNFLCGVATGTLTSVREVEEKGLLSVYPIPAGDELNIRMPSKIHNINYEIIDMSGRVLLEGRTTGSSKLDISSIPAGQYLFRIYDAASGISDGKMIIKR